MASIGFCCLFKVFSSRWWCWLLPPALTWIYYTLLTFCIAISNFKSSSTHFVCSSLRFLPGCEGPRNEEISTCTNYHIKWKRRCRVARRLQQMCVNWFPAFPRLTRVCTKTHLLRHLQEILQSYIFSVLQAEKVESKKPMTKEERSSGRPIRRSATPPLIGQVLLSWQFLTGTLGLGPRQCCGGHLAQVPMYSQMVLFLAQSANGPCMPWKRNEV